MKRNNFVVRPRILQNGAEILIYDIVVLLLPQRSSYAVSVIKGPNFQTKLQPLCIHEK